MKDRILIIECGVAETRAALIENDIAVQFWFGPARGDEAKATAVIPGQRYAGKVTAIDKRLDAAFVDIGAEKPGFLSLSKIKQAPTQGALVEVGIKREPRGGKGASLALKSATVDAAAPGLLEEPSDAVLQAFQAFSAYEISEVITDSGRVKPFLKQSSEAKDIEVTAVEDDLFASFEADEALETSLSPISILPSGGRIIINETEALTAIDVDSGEAVGASGAAIKTRLNIEAAKAAALEIRRRSIGGVVAIDLLKGDHKARKKLDNVLKAEFPKAQKAGWTKSGLFSFVLPRSNQTLLEHATEPLILAPLPGRQFTADWQAKQALRLSEQRLRKSSAVKLKVRLASDLKVYLDAHGEWTDRLNSRYGARCEIVKCENLKGRTFDISEQ